MRNITSSNLNRSNSAFLSSLLFNFSLSGGLALFLVILDGFNVYANDKVEPYNI